VTTPEAPAEPERFQISVCGTCDVVFRVHAGRPSCPVCGGDPNQVLIEGTIVGVSEETPALTEGEPAPPAEAQAEEAPAAGPSDRAPVPWTKEAAAAAEIPPPGRGRKETTVSPEIMAVYRGRRGRTGEWWVTKDSRFFSARPSRKVRNHSPTGFSWGFGGSGPAQLALALLMDLVGDDEALRQYQRFKWDVVSTWPQDGSWEISEREIRRWLGMQRRRDSGAKEVSAAIAT